RSPPSPTDRPAASNPPPDCGVDDRSPHAVRSAPLPRVPSDADDSPSGLWRTLGKRVGSTPSGVRIPHPPPDEGPVTGRGRGPFVVPGKRADRAGPAGHIVLSSGQRPTIVP